MLNAVNIQGRFTANPELKHTNSGQFCSFTLASQRGKNKSGEMITDFAPCIAWGKTAEFIMNRFHKGEQVIIQGRFQSRNYSGQDGRSHVAHEIYVMQVEFCEVRPAVATVAHCTTPRSIEDDYASINWDEVPDLPDSF